MGPEAEKRVINTREAFTGRIRRKINEIVLKNKHGRKGKPRDPLCECRYSEEKDESDEEAGQ